ncbi:hypothetical protein EMA8858_01845 [Emticicia aquatica]|uniref:CotH protein n=1 Tax=Emticicia aquatica TaxID=1681835 RepID=A0ABM9APH0_9BACT|nr:CotH kinase family protein [Emticicia aquatica]CAH0995720.1 hypothetical protein EMA8858_01845 [Emticicia aquatica]
MKNFNLIKITKIVLLTLLSVATFAAKPPAKKPNYSIVFPQNKVNTLEIMLSKKQWDSVRADMKRKYGNDFGQVGMPNMRKISPSNFGNEGMLNFGKGEPNYVSVSVKFRGKTYPNVAFRLKGNSSLMMSWGRGVYKLPFRLDFSEFEQNKKNQKLYGFEKLSFSPSMSDKSLIREKVTADIFRAAGIPAAQTAFYKVYIDFGEGKKYCGVYTLVEVIEDTMVKNQFDTKVSVGNIYKPESNFTQFKKEQFEKKNNKKQADWNDVKAFVNALNSTERTTNEIKWRTDLEKTFNIDHFIKWLAVNNVIVNWDTYGALPHNYYLYHSPTEKLTWIPWDNDQSLGLKMEMPEGFKPPDGFKTSEGFKPPAGFQPPMMGGPMGKGTSLSMKEVGKDWPLIRFIAEDVFYYAKYKQYVQDFNNKVFTQDKMNALFEKNHRLITPFVIGNEKEQKPYSHLNKSEDFILELEKLKEHVAKRNKEVAEFLK